MEFRYENYVNGVVSVEENSLYFEQGTFGCLENCSKSFWIYGESERRMRYTYKTFSRFFLDGHKTI